MTRGKCFLAPNNSQGVYGIASIGVPDYTKNPITAIAGRNVSTSSKNRFGGKFDKVLVGMYITKVIYSDPATIVFWSDGTKTMSKAQHGDIYSKETGLALCVLKKLVGGDQVANLVKDWVTDDTNVVDLRYLRDKEKGKNTVVKEESTRIIEQLVEEIMKENDCKKSRCKKCKTFVDGN